MMTEEDLACMPLEQILEVQSQINRIVGRKITEFRGKVQKKSVRAARQSNSQTIREAALKVIKRTGRAGISKDDIAIAMVTDEGYNTESIGKKWVRSVYQSGILSLLSDGVIERVETEDGTVYRTV